jgi:hypothetical protein
MVPALRRSAADPTESTNEERAKILSKKFFPRNRQADLSDITDDYNPTRFDIDPTVTAQEVEEVIAKLPNNKAPGPDRIQNEVWKALCEDLKEDIAEAITRMLINGTILEGIKESTTVVLRKEKKADYSLPSSYRPIALENTMAKIVEKIIANRITVEMEHRTLIPNN